MKREYMAEGKKTVVRTTLLAVLGVLLVISVYLPSTARAADYTVTEVDGEYLADGDVPVVPVALADADGWTMTQVTVDGNTYQDAEGNYYIPSGPHTFTVTIYRDEYYLPQAGDADVEYLTAVSYSDKGTTLTYTDPRREMNIFYITPPALNTWNAPDEKGVAYASGDYYQMTGDGLTFSMVSMVTLRIEAPMVDDFEEGQLYGQGILDGNSLYGGDFLPGDITLRLNDNYLFTRQPPTVSSWPEGTAVQVSFPDERTISLTSTDWERITAVTLRDLQTQPAPGAAVTVTFEENQYFYVNVGGEKTSSISWALEQDLPLSLQTRPQYSVEDWTQAVTGYRVDNIGYSTEYGEQVVDRYGEMTISGNALTEDRIVTFPEDRINVDAFTRLVAVQDVSGPGYALTSTEGIRPGESGYIVLELTVEADYNQSAPVITPPEGWVIDNDTTEGGGTGDGTMLYYIIMRYGDGENDLVPDTPMDLVVTVSGIEPNYTPPSGGGGGGSREPDIRVENDLNQEGASSDTKLWPNHTTEDKGVSVTTVTDEELEALIDLAQQHIEDIQELEGDGYKEGIIVIEDLGPSSNIHTYILELTGPQFQRISQEDWDRFTVQTPAGSFSLYSDAIRQVASPPDGLSEWPLGLSGKVEITLSRLEYEGRPGVDATLTVDSVPVTSFDSAYSVRVLVPYTPAEGEDVNAILMDYIHEDGTAERVTESCYDAAAGGVYVFTSHLSKFGVAYRPAVYTDVGADHWASPYVTFLAARGLLDSGSTFRPDDKATRGELLELLSEALSAANLPSRAVQVYSDVPAASSVAKAASWAYFNNLTGSITSGGKLRPNEAVTREDMAALTGNVATGVGLRLRSKGLDTGYTDLGDVASYARTSVTRLRAAGILEMADNYKFNPKATLNRGEMAQIVANLLSSL